MRKYLLIEKKENISSFLLKNSLYFVSNKKIYSNVNNNFVNINSNNIYSVENLILSDTEKVYDFNLENYQIFINDDFQYRRRYYKNIVTFNNETNIFFYDIVKNQLVRKMNLNSFTIYGTIYCFINEYAIILGNDTTISAFDYIQEKILWQYDLETYFHQPAQIMEGRVLVSNNKIIFFAHTEDWSNYATFILDAQTGEVLFTTQEMGMKLVEHNNLVYQIQRKAIKILDPKNLKIETIDVSAYCDEQSIFLDDHTVFFYKDKLYTLAREQGSDVYNIWVIFNLKTQQFEHREDMFINPKKKKDEKNKMFINDIQANDNLVAIRCSDNLYVFEKQDIEAK
ncbi:hypothetical protein JMN12_14155 [Capnocytophaga genosp. AHN8471]|uniref:hypothetical protein n=1 Tax=Capnocytophaga genosp. AHN8471 TaxID=327574 RepID=UPI001931AA27|nr:hypothetical protein [Capnocytophaga genosp. AHN8471]MBM0653447.1 hypothetical protein [Capnocytophaga genosp. AHN8471]MBM0657662.1 hypothetical protein [Capnocytophaga genosp. AHN8471]